MVQKTEVHIKDLVERLEGEMLRDVADLELKIQGWQWCDMKELADLVVEHVTETASLQKHLHIQR